MRSGGKMDLVWSLSGNQGDIWHQAQVAVNDRPSSYQVSMYRPVSTKYNRYTGGEVVIELEIPVCSSAKCF